MQNLNSARMHITENQNVRLRVGFLQRQYPTQKRSKGTVVPVTTEVTEGDGITDRYSRMTRHKPHVATRKFAVLVFILSVVATVTSHPFYRETPVAAGASVFEPEAEICSSRFFLVLFLTQPPNTLQHLSNQISSQGDMANNIALLT